MDRGKTVHDLVKVGLSSGLDNKLQLLPCNRYCGYLIGVRRVWNISYRTHCNIFHLLSNALPMYDEIFKRAVNFIKSCLNSDCVLVNRLTYRGNYFEQMRSLSAEIN